MRRAILALAAVLLALPAAAQAAPQLVPVGGSFSQPLYVAGPPGDPSRVFVVEKTGAVQLVVDGQRAATPFADLTGVVTSAAEERGLLSIAFPPDYATSGLFYVFFTTNGSLADTQEGDLVVAEGRRSAGNPNVADPGYLRVLFSITHPATNHNGGQLAFSPADGALYASTGDGGNTPGNAQDDGSRLGKILRVDLPSGTPQIWAKGLRNPWRFSFDRIGGDLLIGDVGENTYEEIDFTPAGAGAGLNYGWNNCEANVPSPCVIGGVTAVAPALTLPHGNGYSAVIGGFVVRDPGLPTLLGRYLFGDINKPALQSAVVNASGGSDLREEPGLPVSTPGGLGEDGCGHLYVAQLGGTVARVQDPQGTPGACVLPQPPGGTPPPGGGNPVPPPPDTRGCGIRVRGQKQTQRVLKRGKRLALRLRADEPCTVILRAKRFRTKTVVLPANVTRTVRLRTTKAGLRKLRRQLRRSDKRRLRVTVTISARDTAGNFGVRRVKPRVR
jgi:glucose/arabinose dehydrogenase